MADETTQPRSAKEVLASILEMRQAMKDGYVLREPEFVLTRTECTRLYDWEQKTRKQIADLERQLKFEMDLSTERLMELNHEKQLREGYQLAAELAIETKQALQLERKELQRTIKQLESNERILDNVTKANMDWADRYKALEDSVEQLEAERNELRDELIRLNPAEGEEEEG